MHGSDEKAYRLFGAALVIWLCGIIYGSFIPFHFHPYSFAHALARFGHVPWLRLGEADRADWVANLLLYMPLSFFAAAAFLPRLSDAGRMGATVAIFVASVVIAVAVEFGQVYFPGRTVSLNDIMAESLGAGLGLTVWWWVGGRVGRAVEIVRERKSGLGRTLLTIYAVGYLVLSLYPYDFVASPSELEAKLTSGSVGLVYASKARGGLVEGMVKLAAEILAAAPLGMWLYLGRAGTRVRGLGRVTLLGGILGCVIEGAQLFTVSGITQGLSVVTRAIGVGGGYYALTVFDRGGLERIRPWTHLTIKLLLFPYIAFILLVNSFHASHWLPWAEAIRRLGHVHFMPFYYYYFTAETHAMFSFLAVAALYLPVGVAVWAWRWGANGTSGERFLIWVTVSVAGAAGVLGEAIKLFAAGKHPDPTDVLIAIAAAVVGYWVCRVVEDQGRADSNGPVASYTRRDENPTGHAAGTMVQPAASPGSLGAWKILAGMPVLLYVAYAALDYPLGAGGMLGILVFYGAVLWVYPTAWIILLPALLPLLAFAMWTGRFFLDEFDVFLLVTLVVGWWRAPAPGESLSTRRLPRVLLAVVGLSYFIGLIHGLLPLHPIGPNSFSNLYSHYNALRTVKGALWALCLVPLVRRYWSSGVNVPRLFSAGMAIGVIGVVGFVLWERFTFSGLFNFANQYRVTGPFQEMHTGGAYIEGYLVTALPFVGFFLLTERNIWGRLLCMALMAGGTYAVLVTFSRGGYVAFAAVVVLLTVAVVKRGSRQRRTWIPRLILPVALVIVVGAVATPILEGPFIQSRFQHIKKDFGVRQTHWLDTISMMNPGAVTSALGMGLGRFPETFFWRNREGIWPATYRYKTQGGNVFLNLGSGNSLYLDQFVAVQPHHTYTVGVDARSKTPNAVLDIPVCEKWMLDSFHCVWNAINVGAGDGRWKHYQVTFNSNNVRGERWYAKRPVKLTLYDARGVIDVDNVSLIDGAGKNLVANGDFSHGNDHWLFFTDNHLPWHVKNLWLQIYFDQGWLGVLAIAAVVVVAIGRLTTGMIRGDAFAAVLLASLVGYLLVGVFGSLVDEPRFLLLFWLVISLGLLLRHGPKPVIRSR